MGKQSTKITAKRKRSMLNEAIADIAFIAGIHRYSSGNSRADMQEFISLAKKFEKETAHINWEASRKDYMTEIEKFADKNLRLIKDKVSFAPAAAKTTWDNIEIEACFEDLEQKATYALHGDKDDPEPDFYSVYLHQVTGGVNCVADLPTEKDAKELGELIQNAVITFKDNGFMPLLMRSNFLKKFKLFIDERIALSSNDVHKGIYEIVKRFVYDHIK